MNHPTAQTSSDTFELSETHHEAKGGALPAVLQLMRLLVEAGEGALATELMAALRTETQAAVSEALRGGNLGSFVRVETRGSTMFGVLSARSLHVRCDGEERDVPLEHVSDVTLSASCATCSLRSREGAGVGACYRVTLVDGSELRHSRLQTDLRFVSMAGLHSVAVSRVRAVTYVRKELRTGWLGLRRRARTTVEREVAQPGDLLRLSPDSHTSSDDAQHAAVRVLARKADQIRQCLGAHALDAALPPHLGRTSVVRLRTVPPPA